MKRNLVFLVGGACMSALVVAALVNHQLHHGQNGLPEILVLRHELSAGETLSSSDITWENWPGGTVPANGYSRRSSTEGAEIIKKVDGARIRRGLAEGEPLLSTSIIRPDSAGFLAAALDAGMRAASIPVSAPTSVGGFVRPGDFVDVILTYEVRVDGGANSRDAAMSIVSHQACETVLDGVRVLAVDQEVHDMEKDAKTGRTVTLEVTPQQAEKLALAGRMGELSLSLRGLNGNNPANKTSYTTDVQVGSALRAATTAMLNSEPGISDDSHTVRLYMGNTASEIKVRKP